MGRAIYGGIYEPGHPAADGDGWRRDVLDLVRELGVTLVRYPGGNFVSGYDWEDGVGPRAARPIRLDRAWRSIEPNAVGTDEFLDWARLAGVQPMLAVNLGTRGAEAARDLVEYCNAPVGTRLADRRAANGHPDPHGVRVWCLGNEMDGPWQIGHTSAAEYAGGPSRPAAAMRLVDPSIELVACGSSGSKMPTFGAWEETVLDICWEVADFVSLHSYYDPADYDSVGDYLACAARPRSDDRDGGGDRRRRRGAQGEPQADRPVRRRVERLAPGRASGPGGTRCCRSLSAGAGPGRGRAGPGRRARRRLPADHPAASRRPRPDRLPRPAGQRDPGDPDDRRRAGLAPDLVSRLRRRRPVRSRDRPATRPRRTDLRGRRRRCGPGDRGRRRPRHRERHR